MLSGSYATVVLVSKTSWILFIAPAKTNARVGNFIRKFSLEQSKGVRTGARRNALKSSSVQGIHMES